MITKDFFGKMPSGADVYQYTLENENGASVKILTLGGILRSINVPDKNGVLADVVCGYDDVNSYLTCGGYQGALIGRFGNRIKSSKFTLDGVEYKLYNNEKANHLHGGKEGFDKKIWDVKSYQVDDTMYLELSYFSPDMEEGYPGNLNVKVTYSFDNNCALGINYKATTDKKTVLNLTNHAYFNLGGYNSGKVENHTLWIDANKVSEVDSELIPTGNNIDVCGTPFDFTTEKLIGKEIQTVVVEEEPTEDEEELIPVAVPIPEEEISEIEDEKEETGFIMYGEGPVLSEKLSKRKYERENKPVKDRPNFFL